MAVPKTAFTLDGLALKVAEKLSVADYLSSGEPVLPTSSKFDMYKVCELVTRGMNMFIDRAPDEGWQWMERSASVLLDPDGTGSDNIDSDPARYTLPVDFGGEASGRIHYTAGSAHSTHIEWCDEQRIRARRSVWVTTGYPLLAAIRPYQPTTNTASSLRRWEMIVDPQPSAADTLEFPYIMNFDGCLLHGGVADSASATTVVDATFSESHASDDYFNDWYIEVIGGTGRGSYALVTDYTGSTGTFTVADWLDMQGNAGGTDPSTDSVFIVKPAHPYYHPAGVTFDGVVEAACLAACELYGHDEVLDDHFANMFYKVKVPEAFNKNKRMRPRRLGKMTNGQRLRGGRTWTNVTTNNDI